MASTKESVRMIQRRSSALLHRSDGGGRIDFGNPAGAAGIRSSVFPGDEMEMTRGRWTSKNGDASGTASRRREDPSGMTRHRLAPEICNQRAYGGSPTTEAGLQDSNGTIEQTQMSLPLERRGPAAGVDVEESTRNRTQGQSRRGKKAERQDGNDTAATKIGSSLAGLPLSKLKIVIGKC